MEKSRYNQDAEIAIRMYNQSRIGVRSYNRFHESQAEYLDPEQEIAEYINSWDAAHLARVKALYATMEGQPFPEDLSTYVVIPAVAGQEIDTLRTTLSQYEKQTADPRTWALMLYVNHTEPYGSHVSQHEVRKTFAVIDEFTANNPQITTHVVQKIYSSTLPIGTIRADAWDTALYALYVNDAAHNPHLIGVSHDGDAAWVSPDYIPAMQQGAIDHPTADLLTCQLNWHNAGDPGSDANKLLRYLEYVLEIQRTQLGIIGLSEANTAIRMASYAAISGFKRSIGLCEMWDLRERFSIARGLSKEDTSHIAYIDGIRLETDSRRLYYAAAHGIAPDDAWNALPFQTGNDPVRNFDTAALANKPIDPAVLEALLARTEKANLWRFEQQERARLQRIGRHTLGLPLLDE